MKKFLRFFLWQRGEGPRFAVAALAGVMELLAFPKFGIAGLAWVAPGLLLASALGANGRTAFRCGCVGGLFFWLSSLSWLLNIPMPKVVPGTGWVALSCYLSLYHGAWVWLCWRCFPARGGEQFVVGEEPLTPALSPSAGAREKSGQDGSAFTPALSRGEREEHTPSQAEMKRGGSQSTLGAATSERIESDQTQRTVLPLPPGEGRGEGKARPPEEGDISSRQKPRPTGIKERGPISFFERMQASPVMNQFVDSSWALRAGWALFCAAVWVALEMIQARLFTGFPWNLLGTSQYKLLPMIQLSSLCGVYGVSFLVAWFSVALWCGVGVVLVRPQRSRLWMGEVILPLLAGVGIAFWGMRVVGTPVTGKSIKIALVQPSIPQTVIWDGEAGPKRFAELMKLSEEALEKKPDVLVWPEAAMPGYLRWDTNLFEGKTLMESVAGLARRGKLWMILGADDAAPGGAGKVEFFNNAFLINPAGEIAGSYHKQRLVIFGEYVPLGGVVPWLRTFSGVTGDFTAGTQAVAFAMPPLGARTSVLICFEDIFPHGVRAHVDRDTGFLLNITNDGWFGESAQQWQHAANAAFRAVENGLPLVRCANNGLTCWIDAHGRMREVYFAGDENIHRAGVKIAEVPLFGAEREMTVYWRNGDWFGWSCVAVAGMFLGLSLVRRREG